MTTQVLAGVDEVPWERMHHAYGAATEVPDLLRGLMSPDPAARDAALDGFYMAVHHQGDVYDSTLATLPFLIRMAQEPGLPGREGVVTLLASLGGAPLDDLSDADELDDPDEPWEMDAGDLDDPGTTNYARARYAVAVERRTWVALLGDGDAGVRAAATEVLTACRNRGDAATAADELRRRFAVEPVARVRASIVTASGRLHPRGGGEGLVAWLHGLIGRDPDLSVRLTAVTWIARITGPGQARDLDADLDVDVAEVEALLEAAYDQRRESPGPPRPGVLALFRAGGRAGGTDRPGHDLEDVVRSVVGAFGDQVETRTRLLTAALRSGDEERRHDALIPAGQLVRGWRGDHQALVRLIGDQLGGRRPLPARAAMVLDGFGQVAAPAQDALHTLVRRLPRKGGPEDRPEPWIVHLRSDPPTLGSPLRTFAATGDPRVLPMLARVLRQRRPPTAAAFAVAEFGAAAIDLVPLLRARLADPWDDERPDSREGAAPWVNALWHVAGAEALPEMLALPPAEHRLRDIGSAGAAAAAAIPRLAEWATGEKPEIALAAALALRRVQEALGDRPDPDVAIGPVMRLLGGDDIFDHGTAFRAIADVGPAGMPGGVLPRLQELARDVPHPWYGTALARARRALTGDDRTALRESAEVWSRPGVVHRVELVEFWAAMGPSAAEVEPLLLDELADPRRLGARDPYVHSSDVVVADERFQAAARRALAAIRGDAPR